MISKAPVKSPASVIFSEGGSEAAALFVGKVGTMAKKPEWDAEPVDTSHLTDADWAAINDLKRAYSDGGAKALSVAMGKIAEEDPIRYLNVIGAYFPEMLAETIKDSIAEAGMTEEDIRELVRKLESPARQNQ